ncbi:MAG: CHC2 zinc finger domain-containing protein, partial [Bacilli bacterium]
MNNNRQKIVDNVDIVSEVSKYINIEAKGRNYVAICPFHADSNPSLTISPEKRIFKCFVCGEGGDVVNFVSKYEKISQNMAIEKIAHNNRIKIVTMIEKVQKSPLDFLINDMTIFYQSSLSLTNQGKKAQSYLKERNINSDTIKHFKLGFGYSENKALYHYLEKKIEENMQYTEIDIEQLHQFSNQNDMFINRLIIPIVDNNKIVGFGGREIDGASTVKYL